MRWLKVLSFLLVCIPGYQAYSQGFDIKSDGRGGFTAIGSGSTYTIRPDRRGGYSIVGGQIGGGGWTDTSLQPDGRGGFTGVTTPLDNTHSGFVPVPLEPAPLPGPQLDDASSRSLPAEPRATRSGAFTNFSRGNPFADAYNRGMEERRKESEADMRFYEHMAAMEEDRTLRESIAKLYPNDPRIQELAQRPGTGNALLKIHKLKDARRQEVTAKVEDALRSNNSALIRYSRVLAEQNSLLATSADEPGFHPHLFDAAIARAELVETITILRAANIGQKNMDRALSTYMNTPGTLEQRLAAAVRVGVNSVPAIGKSTRPKRVTDPSILKALEEPKTQPAVR